MSELPSDLLTAQEEADEHKADEQLPASAMRITPSAPPVDHD